jgi:outer membrane receptor protein involved in Fe transport
MMGRKFYLPFILAIFFAAGSAVGQSGEIRGKVMERGTREGVPFSSVAAFQNGAQVQATVTDFEGNYSLKPLNPGKYDVKATSVGFTAAEVQGVLVSADKSAFVDIELGKGVQLDSVIITGYKVPLIDKGNPATQKTMQFEDIQAAPVREVNAIAAQSAGVYTNGGDGQLYFRGSRSDATAYYVDGVKVRGNLAISNKAAEQITVITGGVPAQYGDLTGGIVSVSTRGPSKDFTGGLEFVSSKLFDDYDYNQASFAFSGPIFTKRDSVGRKSGQPLLGFFVAGDYTYQKDRFPSYVDLYKVKDDVLADIEANPLVKAQTGFGFNRKAEYVTYDDMETIGYHQNIPQKVYRINPKLDFRPANNVYVSLGGDIEYIDQTDYSRLYELFNYKNNSHTTNQTYRVFGKLTQRFGDASGESKSDIKNAYYTIQADYTNFYGKTENSQHEDRLFDYGYVGRFTTTRTPFYFQLPGDNFTTYFGDFSTNVDFEPYSNPSNALILNPLMTNYTTQYYSLAPSAAGYYQDIRQIPLNGGLINGDNRFNQNVYGIWAATGRVPTGYGYQSNEQFHISLQGSADIKNHSIIAGMEYEQRTDRFYQVLPSRLWDAMRNLGNFNIQSLDISDSIWSANMDTLYFNYLYNPTQNVDSENAVGFYENVRTKLGIPMNQWVDIDKYDPSTYSLNMFPVDQLLAQGVFNSGSYGYNMFGAKDNAQGGLDGFQDFLTKKDENNNFVRPMPAFRPIYAAGYISDRFTLNDLIFNVGVRVDIFNANQPAMKDKYLLYNAYTAGQLQNTKFSNVEVPDGIGDDYVVYVNDIYNPTKILGYRNGDHWYNAEGSEINNVNDELIQASSNTSGTIQPFLVDPQAAKTRTINIDAFKNYEVQTTFMPRIAFSFPISDEAYFAAHYDILTQRPPNSGLLRFNPYTYYLMSQGIAGTISNPDLKPEKTTSYEISFQQKLTNSSAFTIAAFYKELKDMIEIINVPYAYPITYQTFGNVDFGTTKGLTFSYDLRRTANVRMNIAYTLQFANGTGSNPGTNAGLLSINSEMTNLREPMPLNYDQRHTINVSLDYHYSYGKNYNGPVWFGKQVFSNAGLNILMNAGSGTPYTRIKEPVQTQNPSVVGRTQLAGSINGSRLPWQFSLDAKLDKSFKVKTGKKADGRDRRALDMNVYLQVLNVLDSRLVTGVYQATGNPDDDGYLTSPKAQSSIQSQIDPASYITMYSISMNDPGNYLAPRRVRLGVQVNF